MKKYLETNEDGTTTLWNWWDVANNSEREVYSNAGFPQQSTKSQVNNLIYHLKQWEEEEEQIKPNVIRRKEIIKNQRGNNLRFFKIENINYKELFSKKN